MLGIFGGGQLGRMFTHAAQARGYHVCVFEREENCPAAQAANRHVIPSENEAEVADQVAAFARDVQAVTLEFENVPAEWLQVAAQFVPTRPGAEFLNICQHRFREKSAVQAAGFPVTPFQLVKSAADIIKASQTFGWPMIVKTCRSGYDGKGQVVVTSATAAATAFESLHTDEAIAEKRINFVAEVSMLGARNARGDIVTYPLVENSHANHILDISRCPVSPELMRYESAAQEIVAGLARQLGAEGLFCVEFFIDACNGLMVNEIAPRPHNSGHLTIEAFPVSQFDQQLRALCNLPLGATQEFRPSAMANLLGDLWTVGSGMNWSAAFAQPDTFLHLYGKAEPRVGRKMGHLTCLANTAEEAVARVQNIRQSLVN